MKEGQSYARESIYAVGNRWDQQELTKRASPEMLKTIDEDPTKISRFFNAFAKKLGGIKSLKDPESQNYNQFFGTDGAVFDITLVYPAQFEKADGKVNITVSHRGKTGRSKISSSSQKSLSPTN